MNILLAAAAAVNPFDDPMLRMRSALPAVRERMVLLVSILVVAVVVLIWLWLSAKARRRAARREDRRQRRRSYNRQTPVEDRPPVPSGRRRRRKHRPRNPTLAETGGLPPMRGSDTQPPVRPPH